MKIELSRPRMSGLVSQLPTVYQMKSEVFKSWLDEIREKNRFHRKQWEYIYVLQALHEHNLLREGMSGLGFGVGSEPLPAVMAAHGCTIVATEINIEKSNEKGWVKGKSVEELLGSLNSRGICEKDRFKRLVSFRDVDMNDTPSDLRGFDFTWSSCALEHLGTLKSGQDFILNSLNCLKPGGLAVHTTEYTFARNRTVESGSTVYYRKKDIVALANRLGEDGHDIALNFSAGRSFLDWYVDFSPFRNTRHIKLLVSKRRKLLLTTSIGLIIKKRASGCLP
jgi:hypothetical protein